jgi:hypothetical protein
LTNEADEITDGIEQLLDLVRILVLAVNQNSAWISNLASRSIALFDLVNFPESLQTSSELAAQALVCLIDTTELFPFVIKIDLYGGIFSVYDSAYRWEIC